MAVQSQLVTPKMVYIHLETTNQSFIDMHYYLKSQGIQNNDFFLALLDSGLAGVDPRDPNLSQAMKARIMMECRLNYWYFFLVIAGVLSMFIDNIQFITSPLRIIGLFFCNYNISKKLHKDNVFAVLMTLFSYIMIPLIGFSRSYEFDNNVTVSPNGPITDSETNNFNNENTKYCSGCGTKININDKFCPNCGKEIQ